MNLQGERRGAQHGALTLGHLGRALLGEAPWALAWGADGLLGGLETQPPRTEPAGSGPRHPSPGPRLPPPGRPAPGPLLCIIFKYPRLHREPPGAAGGSVLPRGHSPDGWATAVRSPAAFSPQGNDLWAPPPAFCRCSNPPRAGEQAAESIPSEMLSKQPGSGAPGREGRLPEGVSVCLCVCPGVCVCASLCVSVCICLCLCMCRYV